MDYESKPQPQTLQAEMDRQVITVVAVFVPWSKSRDFEAGRPVWNRTLQWTITVRRGDRDILSTEYGAGIAHAPAYKAPKERFGHQYSVKRHDALVWELENGFEARPLGGGYIKGPAILPKPADVIYGLCSDASAIDNGSFEDWAAELGFDPDSRKAEATYRACLEIALKLRAALGDAGLTALRDACQEY